MRNVLVNVHIQSKEDIEKWEEALQKRGFLYTIEDRWLDGDTKSVVYNIMVSGELDSDDVSRLYSLFKENKEILPSIYPGKRDK